MTFILSMASLILYRLGGMKGKWFNTKIRDLGCPTAALVWMLIFTRGYSFFTHFIAFGLLFASLTTYYDESKNKIKDSLARLINWQYPKDNLYLHGGMIGLAYFPYAVEIGIYFNFFYRAVLLGVFMGALNYVANKYKIPHSDWVEECGRGAMIVLTLPILFI